MKKYTSKQISRSVKSSSRDAVIRRQQAHLERFMQEKADVFQVTEGKAQAMFWAMQTV